MEIFAVIIFFVILYFVVKAAVRNGTRPTTPAEPKPASETIVPIWVVVILFIVLGLTVIGFIGGTSRTSTYQASTNQATTPDTLPATEGAGLIVKANDCETALIAARSRIHAIYSTGPVPAFATETLDLLQEDFDACETLKELVNSGASRAAIYAELERMQTLGQKMADQQKKVEAAIR
jgi:hypothetical protein